MVLATVASAVGHSSTCRSDTSIAMTSPARCVGQHVVCACRSNHHSQAHSIPDVCTVEVAFDSRAITSGQKQKPPPTLPEIRVCQQWLLSEHAPCSIFTMFDALHLRHQRTRFRASVSGRTACDVSRPQFGQTINPFFVSSLAAFSPFCNAFSSLS